MVSLTDAGPSVSVACTVTVAMPFWFGASDSVKVEPVMSCRSNSAPLVEPVIA